MKWWLALAGVVLGFLIAWWWFGGNATQGTQGLGHTMIGPFDEIPPGTMIALESRPAHTPPSANYVYWGSSTPPGWVAIPSHIVGANCEIPPKASLGLAVQATLPAPTLWLKRVDTSNADDIPENSYMGFVGSANDDPDPAHNPNRYDIVDSNHLPANLDWFMKVKFK